MVRSSRKDRNPASLDSLVSLHLAKRLSLLERTSAVRDVAIEVATAAGFQAPLEPRCVQGMEDLEAFRPNV